MTKTETEYQKFNFTKRSDGSLTASALDLLNYSIKNDNDKLRLIEEFPPGTTFNAFGKKCLILTYTPRYDKHINFWEARNICSEFSIIFYQFDPEQHLLGQNVRIQSVDEFLYSVKYNYNNFVKA